MQCAWCWSIAVLALCVTRLSAAQTTAAPAAAPRPGADPASVPLCEWGTCAAVCNEPCPSGSVCGVGGTCVDVVDRQQIAQDLADDAEDQRDTQRSLVRRNRARYWPRFALGAGIGGVGLFDRKGQAGEFLAHFGVRQQLGKSVGLHTQLVGALGLRFEKDAAGASHRLTLYETAASVTPYFGPFDRMYLGPCLLLGYRWYSDAMKEWFASTARVQNHVVREGGLRLGVLAGAEEQIDISGLLSSSFDADTPWHVMVSVAYEVR